jgi:predicted transcriptional regulator
MATKTPKRKITVYLDPEVARAAKVRAARAEKRDSEVIEEALREYLGWTALDQAQAISGLSEKEAMEIANREVHAYRRERGAAGQQYS